MSECEMKKIQQEDPRPLLSLDPRLKSKTETKSRESEQEGEALWMRSLEYFEHMNDLKRSKESAS